MSKSFGVQSAGSGEISEVSITAGENLVAGNIIYFKVSDQKYYKAKADDIATCGTELLYCNSTISADATGKAYDRITITGSFTAGTQYLSSSTAGAQTATAPSTPGHKIVALGNATSAQFRFRSPNPNSILGV